MGRPKKDKYWNQVEKLKDGAWRCRRCNDTFKGGAYRIEGHIEGIPNRGIRFCKKEGIANNNITGSSNLQGVVNPINLSQAPNVPDNEGIANNNVAGSSNLQEVVNPIHSSQVPNVPDNERIANNNVAGPGNPQEAVNPIISSQGIHEMIDTIIAGSSNHQTYAELNNLWEETEAGLLQTEEGVNESDNNSPLEDVKELVDNLARVESDIKKELEWFKSHGKKRKRSVDDWLKKTEDLTARARLRMRVRADELQSHIAGRPVVLYNELVGTCFERHAKTVLKLLSNDEVFVIGIHGMGGVGKTCLAKHIRDHIKRNTSFYNFKHVFWVTVSQNFNIFKLQNDIAKIIGLKLDEGDEITKAEMLSSALVEKGKCLVILDDVWNYVNLSKVGIPLRVNGTKLILTSRLKHVCHQLDFRPDHIVSMEPLCNHEAWELFLLKLGYDGTPAELDPNIEEIAQDVARKCDGLPLGISVMARRMKGVNNTVNQWRHALKKLQSSAVEEMGAEVFKVLKFSYDHLTDKNIQNCFLNCALYRDIIRSKEFIMRFVDRGLIDKMGSMEEVFDEGVAILNKLQSDSLLLDEKGDLRMHELVRDMACHIMGPKYMVKCDKGLTEIPHISKWTVDLDAVSLAWNEIREIPADMSPQCPNLSTLIFIFNRFSCIPDCFFDHMNTLTLLDLSQNYKLTCLPDSVSNLRSLVSLLLKDCYSLQYIPPLGELKKLSRLDISDTSIEEVPEGLETLINLKWLDLSQNRKLTMEPRSVLPSLVNMQFIDLRGYSPSANVNINVEDVQGMRMLQCIACNFKDGKNLNDYVRGIIERGYEPKTYHLHLGIPDFGHKCVYGLSILDDRTVCIGDCQHSDHLLPTCLTKLRIADNKQWTGCLCDALSFMRSSSLRHIDIEGCSKIESLFCVSFYCSFCAYLSNLYSLSISCLKSFDVIFKQNNIGIGFFSHLKHLKIGVCHKMEKLLIAGSLPQLPNLEEIHVSHCDSMKEIFLTEDDHSTITLHKLTRLTLLYLPQLNVVCRGVLVSKSPPEIICNRCPCLQRSLQYTSSDSVDHSVITLEITSD